MSKLKRCQKKTELWVWKLKDEKTREEYIGLDMNRDRVEEKGW